VLPLWRDEVVAYVAPDRVALVRLNRGLRPKVVASVEVGIGADSARQPQTAFARLAELLTDTQWQNASAQVVLADYWVRYVIVPAPAIALDADGRLSHARYVLADQFGDAVSQWTVTLTDSPPGESYLACAMPSALPTEIGDVFSAANLTLKSLRPKLVVSFNAWRQRLSGDESWFVSLEEGSLAAVQIVAGHWHRVHTMRLPSDWVIELKRLKAFGRLAEERSGAGQLMIDAPTNMRELGQRELPELDWLEPDQRQEALPMLQLLKRVNA
jgi:hypothetical protein